MHAFFLQIVQKLRNNVIYVLKKLAFIGCQLLLHILPHNNQRGIFFLPTFTDKETELNNLIDTKPLTCDKT